jgi:hypothetical protein
VSEVEHSFEIKIEVDGKVVATSSGTQTISGWPDAPADLVRARLVIDELNKLVEIWSRAEEKERAEYEAKWAEA